ncbi:MAG: maltose alpha-D-glucosyltransferase [Spirochaetes bacterium GWF1_31_7]|nr:MAG: maltose alpha-D-glucosyltransferase [Spirochaetes bacterium GWE1_32_154]OHD49946.1 MAG: maltose alpha-D-glucosyltransferase [Spirochaetes bacterium GWE2_31_10]OHD52264.1 MAG: maltose alpha-D-glucosyltransferase [Spirochaetes bacterium GWF1_31_7]OHD72997.1 MAG: maltose alpha-D-glucosyltransferase [Spirochaetes bacterium RIFOXYB1_FULL_32_8]HBI38405.1 maltose alpha-D-glucosyltransferase [Spirochaetia bacterium]
MSNPWYKNAVFYEVYVKGFHDHNNDGKGDFKGLTSKLDYIANLGIDCIWLLPMYPSPGKDDGYDIMNYYEIHKDYGTLDDFKHFLDESHKRGIRVIADLVLNHISDQHPWFIEAVNNVYSKYHNYFVWSHNPEKYKEARIIFVDTEISNWTWSDKAKKYYWHRFFYHQPDLNYENPDVQEEMIKVLDYWLGLGLDGFRVDAVPYLFEQEGTSCENLPQTHEYLKKIRKFVDNKYPDCLLLAEANQWPEDLLPYFGDGDEFHMAFNFPLMPRMFMALRQEHHGPIIDIIQRIPAIPENCQWAIFLRNHDELTLEMVTDEERDYMYKQYAKDEQMKINVGIRRRLAPLLENSRNQIELLNTILLCLPGAPVIYYGDELGMGDNIYLGDRNGVRTPMHWNVDRNAGFSKCNPSKLYAPVITDPEYDYHTINVENQENNIHSLLNWTKHMLKQRRKFSVFGSGTLRFIYPENKRILAFFRENDNERLLCVFNLSHLHQPVELYISEYKGFKPVEIIGEESFPYIGELPYLLTLSPHSFFIFELVQ